MNSRKAFRKTKNCISLLFLTFLVSLISLLLHTVPTFAAAKADLIPTAITYQQPIKVNQAVNFDSGIKNAGQTATGTFNIKWFVNNKQVGYGSHSGIPAGKTVMNGNSQLSYKFTAPGTYTIKFVVDCDNHIPESNESNNEKSITITIPKADLIPTDITYTQPIKVNQTVNFDSGIKNAGQTATGTFNVKWFVNNKQVGYGGHSSIPANTTIMNGNSQLSYKFTAPGTYTIKFVVDCDNHIPESNENNNEKSITITITKADLIPTDITYTQPIKVNQAVNFDSGIKNAGQTDTGIFNIKWYVNNKQVGYGGHSGIPASTTNMNGNSQLSYTFTSPGTYTIKFVVDCDNHISESNESNNEKSITVTVVGTTKNTISQKVLVLNFDPIIENVPSSTIKPYPSAPALPARLHDAIKHYGADWSDPRSLSQTYADDLYQASGYQLKYNIVEWVDLDEFPLLTDGYQYTDDTFMNTYKSAVEQRSDWWAYSGWHDCDFKFDYNYYLDRFNIPARIKAGEIDEVWIFGMPFAGTYESRMVGKTAYWCNSTPIIRNDCRNFVVMGFNYERGVGEMLEDFGHRTESIMSHKFGRWDYSMPFDSMNKWEKFTLYDAVKPGKAGCGNVHFAPNSTVDYQWGNTTYVQSTCNDWKNNYPNLTGASQSVNCSTWGNGDIRLHHIWWFSCIPKADGTDEQGFLNNWWYYMADLANYPD
jgi:subtilase family serine protease